MLQLLPRSSTGERMNPYTSLWTGVHAGDGPREFHLVLLDNGRTDVLADEVGRQALHCIRCSACLNACPVYSRTGGHAYESVYPGPIGAILTPQLRGLGAAPTLPWASSLCGACYEVCPVKIDIPAVLVHLRGRVVRERALAAGSRAGGDARDGARCSPRGGATSARSAWRGWGRGPVAKLRGGPLSAWTRHARPAGDPGAELPRLVAIAAVTGDARDVVLARVRAALRGSDAAAGRARTMARASRSPARSRAPTARRAGQPTRPSSWSASASAWATTARGCTAPRRRRSTTVVAGLLADRRVLVPAAPPCAVHGFEVGRRTTRALTARELDGADAALTGCALAIAETGTIVLDGSAACGRRALTLVPDHHVCVVRAEQIVADVPDAIAALRRRSAERRPITLVSGPSATSDIELERVEGVHGPRRLDVVVVSATYAGGDARTP